MTFRNEKHPFHCTSISLYGFRIIKCKNIEKLKETQNKSTKKCLVLGFFWWAGVDSDHRSQVTTDLQSVPFGRSGTCPHYGAGDWNRTHNLLITNQLLCQLSYTSEKIKKNGALGRNRTTDRGIFSPLLYRLSYQGILFCP